MSRSRRQKLACYAHYNRRNMTQYEKKLWYEFLVNYELPFVCQKVVGNYILDFYCRKVRLCIEVDGGQHYEEKSQIYDEYRTMFLEMNEITVIRFSNAEIYEEFEGVCETIDRVVKSLRHDIHSDGFKLLISKK